MLVDSLKLDNLKKIPCPAAVLAESTDASCAFDNAGIEKIKTGARCDWGADKAELDDGPCRNASTEIRST